jgi:hypothetical protein
MKISAPLPRARRQPGGILCTAIVRYDRLGKKDTAE